MRLKISSRKSDLARIQAYSVGEALLKIHPSFEIEYLFRESLGDKNLDNPLWKMPEKGVFTEDFRDDLLGEKTDIVVHSWKDLPIDTDSQTKIAATLPREDQRDVLLIPFDRQKNTSAIHILSSSPRREFNLSNFLKEALPHQPSQISFESVRGNVPTRLNKLLTGEAYGLVVAKAALDRILGCERPEFKKTKEDVANVLKRCFVMILPLEKDPTAAAQGALALEIKTGRADLETILAEINCETTFRVVNKERQMLKEFGGGCHQKVGVSIRSYSYGDIHYIRALTDAGQFIDDVKFYPAQNLLQTKSDCIFPQTAGDGAWFEREPCAVSIPHSPLWVARSEALPEGFSPGDGQLVWASGWETWKKLAKKGIWVNGCSEGLGEKAGLHRFSMWPDLSEWAKLTHDRAESNADSPARFKEVLRTYRLRPRSEGPSIEGKTHFYWTSGSSFLRALELFPEIQSHHHFCGPGNTYDVISQKAQVTIVPTYKMWRELVLK